VIDALHLQLEDGGIGVDAAVDAEVGRGFLNQVVKVEVGLRGHVLSLLPMSDSTLSGVMVAPPLQSCQRGCPSTPGRRGLQLLEICRPNRAHAQRRSY